MNKENLEDKLITLKERQSAIREESQLLYNQIKGIEKELRPTNINRLIEMVKEINKFLKENELEIFCESDYELGITFYISSPDEYGERDEKISYIEYKGQKIYV